MAAHLDQQRWKTVLKKNNSVTKTTIFAGDYEKITDNGVTQQLYYISGADGLAAVYVKQTGQSDKTYYAHTDHLGSIIKLTDNNGVPVFKATYDAWGLQTVTTNTFKFHRGYTGHEHLPEFGLINMIISPDWGSKEHRVYQNVRNAKYTVGHVPSWLDIASMSGQFIKGTASLNCKANKYSLFSEIGFYCDYITLSIEDKGVLVVPTIYIVEGTPVVEIPSCLTIDDNNLDDIKLPIKNTGNGILTWSVSKYPEWLSLKYNHGTIVVSSIHAIALRQNREGAIVFSYHSTGALSEYLSGKIVITTNDKNNPEVEIPVELKVPPRVATK